jgi:hypothetical protein
MKTQITSIETINDECVKVTAVVYWRRLPSPDYQNNETDEQYSARVLPIAKEIESYNNLHLGWAEIKQEVDKVKIPTVAEYDS